MNSPRSRERYRLISSDTHVLEPPDLWTARVDRRFRDRVPRIEWSPRGGAWVIEGAPEPIAFGFTMSAGRRPEDLTDWLQPNEVDQEAWGDPAKRIEIMDADGLDAEVLFPNRPWQGVVGNRDPELHLAMMRAYNDWLSEFCSYAPTRMAGLAGVPNRGVAAAVEEVSRCAELPGIAGFLITGYPHGGTSISADDDPVWEVISASGKPLAIHIFLDDTMPFNIRADLLPGSSHFYDCPRRLLDIISSGVLERFPDLKIVFHETDCGWIPYFAAKLDELAVRTGAQFPRTPSDYIRERFWFSFIHDPVGVANRDWLGADRLLWSNDYPHIASDWPNSWHTVNTHFRGLPAGDRERILWRNTYDLYLARAA